MLFYRITSPAELARLANELDPSKPSPAINISICLLSPLSDPETLTACRQNSTFDGDDSKTAIEYIDIKPVSDA